MSIFAVQYRYVDDPALLDQHRPDHRAYLATLVASGHNLVSGAFVGGEAGALLVFRADSEEQVKQFTDNDPFQLRGCIVSVTIRQWNSVLGAASEHFVP